MTATGVRSKSDSHSRWSADVHGRRRAVTTPRAGRNIRTHWLRDAVRVSVLATSDLAVATALWVALRMVRMGWGPAVLSGPTEALFPRGGLSGGQFAVALIIGLVVAGSYGTGDARRDLGRVFGGVALAALVSLYARVWNGNLWLVLAEFIVLTAVLGLALSISRLVVDRALAAIRPRLASAPTVLVSDGTNDWIDPASVDQNGSSLKVVGRVATSSAAPRDDFFPLNRLEPLIEQTGADTVIVCGPISDSEFAFVVDTAHVHGCRLLAASRTQRAAGTEPRGRWIQGLPLIELTRPSLKASQLAAKRIVDIAGSVAGLVLLSPMFGLLAALIRIDSRGPIFFGQVRLGGQGRQFRCFKFRTMREDAEDVLRSDPELYGRYLSNNFKLPEMADPRLTRMGRFLRATSLDELPQLWNVLRGEMSLVGPRPIVPDEIEHYDYRASLFLSLRPGMTGAWATAGRSRVGYPHRADMELEYVRNWSLFADLRILLLTVPAVFARRGAH